jgi:twitching motility protein PilT
MARIDTFLAQLMAYEAESLLVESGDNLYLVKGAQRIPLMQVRAGAIANAHVAALLAEIAPAEVRAGLDAVAPGQAMEWEYQWGTCFFHVEVVVVDGRMCARLQEVSGAAIAPAMVPSSSSATTSPAEDLAAAAGDEDRPHLETFLRAALERGSSDLHLTADRVPMCRVDGEMVPLTIAGVRPAALDPYGLQKMIEEIVPDRARVELEATHDVDFSYELPASRMGAVARAGARVRCNVFRDSTGLGGVFRCFPLQPRNAQEIGLPDAVLAMCARRRGLIVVTGPGGTGKSTTIAAMIDWINANRADHIVTIEDPVEIVHAPKRCVINQRQVGEHTGSFARALRAAQREDPDVVVVGEVRDRETMAAALEMAETHLVIVAMHTASAAAALERILDRFPLEQQPQMRNLLAECLLGVVAQTLCKRNGGGRVAAFDVVTANTELAAQVRNGVLSDVPRALDDHLRDLFVRGVIDESEALARAHDARTLFARPRAVA